MRDINNCLDSDYALAGKYVVERDNYLWEFCPDHPFASKWGYVPQHRLVVERKLQRFLTNEEVVHHKDENKQNNSVDNLVVMTKAEHMAIHQRLRHDAKYPEITRSIVKSALETGGIKKAAIELGVNQMTIRKNFPDLVEPYKRKTPANLKSPELISSIRELAPDENIGLRQAVKILGCSAQTVMRICKENDIEWVKKSKKGETHSKYIRRGEEYVDNPELIAEVLPMAEDASVSMEEAAEKLGFSDATLKRILKHNNIKWVPKSYYSYPREGDEQKCRKE